MLPGFRILVATIVLSASVLVFGLGAAALLRAAHEEFASLPSWRLAQPPLLSPKIEPAPATLALLRLETPQARLEPLRIEPEPFRIETPRIETRRIENPAPETAAPAMSAPEVQAETQAEVQTVTANAPHETGGMADEKSDAVIVVTVARPDAEPNSAVSAPAPAQVASANTGPDVKANGKTNARTKSSPNASNARSAPEVTNTEATSSDKTEITSSEMAALVAKASEATAAAEQQADPVVTKTNRSSARAAARRRAVAVARARAAARARAVQQQPQQNPFPLFGG